MRSEKPLYSAHCKLKANSYLHSARGTHKRWNYFKFFNHFTGLPRDAWKYELALMHDAYRYLLVHVLSTDLHVTLYTVMYPLQPEYVYSYSMLLLYALMGMRIGSWIQGRRSIALIPMYAQSRVPKIRRPPIVLARVPAVGYQKRVIGTARRASWRAQTARLILVGPLALCASSHYYELFSSLCGFLCPDEWPSTLRRLKSSIWMVA